MANLESTVPPTVHTIGVVSKQVTGKLLAKSMNLKTEHVKHVRVRQLPELVKEEKKKKKRPKSKKPGFDSSTGLNPKQFLWTDRKWPVSCHCGEQTTYIVNRRRQKTMIKPR